MIFLTDGGERDYLPHQEARMKAGLEKAVQHKDKLLEFDRNRYYSHHFLKQVLYISLNLFFFLLQCEEDPGFGR